VHHCWCVAAQVDGLVGFEAAVSAATGQLRAEVSVERREASSMRRAIAVLRGEVSGLESRAKTAAVAAERDAAVAALAALRRQVDADAPIMELGRAELRRRAEEATRHEVTVADAIAHKVATPLLGPAAGAYLRALGFPASSQPAGITWGLDRVPAAALSASSSYTDGQRPVHPGCRLLYPKVNGAPYIFLTGNGHVAGEWVQVDLGSERSVVGALVQSYEDDAASAEAGCRWHRHKFQRSTNGVGWADVEGGRVWSRDGLRNKDVSAAVFAAPVRCRFLRIVAVSTSGYLRWEAVVQP